MKSRENQFMTPADDQSELLDSMAPWLNSARAGQASALGHVLNLCRDYLLKVANGELPPNLRPKVAASDLVQEAFLEAQRLFDRFHGDSAGELVQWLRAILLHKLETAVRHYQGTAKRRLDREQSLDALAELGGEPAARSSASPSGLAQQDEETKRLHRALARLPDHYRQVIVWREWEDLPFAEIGRRLDRTEDAARMLWGRALEKLQDELEALG
jgi:RNA polymerase sigma-70 factor (ECF subfamily)